MFSEDGFTSSGQAQLSSTRCFHNPGTSEELGLKGWWKGLKEDKPEKRYISPSERRAFPKTLGYPPRPKPAKHGPWAPGETKPPKYKEHSDDYHRSMQNL